MSRESGSTDENSITKAFIHLHCAIHTFSMLDMEDLKTKFQQVGSNGNRICLLVRIVKELTTPYSTPSELVCRIEVRRWSLENGILSKIGLM